MLSSGALPRPRRQSERQSIADPRQREVLETGPIMMRRSEIVAVHQLAGEQLGVHACEVHADALVRPTAEGDVIEGVPAMLVALRCEALRVKALGILPLAGRMMIEAWDEHEEAV